MEDFPPVSYPPPVMAFYRMLFTLPTVDARNPIRPYGIEHTQVMPFFHISSRKAIGALQTDPSKGLDGSLVVVQDNCPQNHHRARISPFKGVFSQSSLLLRFLRTTQIDSGFGYHTSF